MIFNDILIWLIDILPSMDDGKVTALTLLDHSTAFDTIDHTILLSTLNNWLGLNGGLV